MKILFCVSDFFEVYIFVSAFFWEKMTKNHKKRMYEETTRMAWAIDEVSTKDLFVKKLYLYKEG